MHGAERETGGAWLSVGWQHASADPGEESFERGAAFAAALARTLRATGYDALRLEVALGRGQEGELELLVTGDVPGMPQADFECLARVTLNAVGRRRDLAAGQDSLAQPERYVLRGARLEPSNGVALPPASASVPVQAALAPAGLATPAPSAGAAAGWRGWLSRVPLGRLAIGLFLGLLLGVLGLPRIELPRLTLSGAQPTLQVAQPTLPVAQPTLPVAQPTFRRVLPTPESIADRAPAIAPTVILPTPGPRVVAAPAPTLVPAVPEPRPTPAVVFAERFVTPLVDWPNDVQGNAWFDDGAYHLMAREPGRFVAVGVPVTDPLGDGAVSAQFHKVGGPAGGGYGLIVRDQGTSGDRDSHSQAGRYLVLEVGDRGEVGIWQRDDTRWVDVLAWRAADPVRAGAEPNVLAVYLRGTSVRFEVNGETVAEVEVAALPTQGGVGIFVGGELNEAALEWLRIEAI